MDTTDSGPDEEGMEDPVEVDTTPTPPEVTVVPEDAILRGLL